MLVFARDQRQGRCVFADRYQHRLQLNWSMVPGPPQMGAMLENLRSEIVQDARAKRVELVDLAGWSGLLTVADGVTATRFSRYFAEEGCLLEIVFLWPGKRELHLERSVLDSVGIEAESPEGCRRWRAFGMDLLASSDLVLQTCMVKPGMARMVFGDPQQPSREERFERLGMVTHWLHRPVAEWLRVHTAREITVRSTSAVTVAGHVIECLTGDTAPMPWWRVWLGRIPYTAAAWICPTDARLYSLSVRGRVAEEQDGTRRRRLVCCKDLG